MDDFMKHYMSRFPTFTLGASVDTEKEERDSRDRRHAIERRAHRLEWARLMLELIDAKRSLYGAPNMDGDVERAVLESVIGDMEEGSSLWDRLLKGMPGF